MVNLTPQQTQVLREAQAESRRLGTDVVGLANQIMSDLAPAEVKAAGGMSQWIEKNQQFIAADVAGHIKGVTAEIKSVVNGIGGWKNASGDLLEFWGAKFAPGILGPLLRADALIRVIEQYGEKHKIAGSQTAGSAARGAIIGGTIGSMVPIVGTGAGAAVGAIAGGLWDNDPFGGATPADAWRYMMQGGGGAAGAAPRLPTSAARRRTMQEASRDLRNMGWSRAQTAGILANLSSESGFDPHAVGDHGTSYGLAQWHAGRLRLFSQWLRQATHGKTTDPRQATVAQQMQFLNWELRHGDQKKAGDALMQQTDPRGAGYVVAKQFERPAGGEATYAMRANNAELFLPQKQPNEVALHGGANLHIRIDGAGPGATAAADTYGNVFDGAPKVVMPLPYGGGPAS